MFRRLFFGCLISVLLILTAIPGEAAVALKPNISFTTPFRIEKVDYPASTFTGTHISLKYKQDINRTYISYYDVTQHTLKLAFNPWPQPQGNCNGIVGHWSCVTLDGDGASGHSSDDVGMYSSVDVSTAAFIMIGVSYYDRTLQALKYAQYACAFQCTLALYTIDIAQGMEIGSYGTALKFTQNATPYIAYSFTNPTNHNQDELRLAHQVTSGGNCGVGADHGKWQCEVITRGNQVGRSPSIALYENPGLTVQVAYLSGLNVLYYAVSHTGETCSINTASNWRCYILDPHAGGDVSLVSFNTIPSIAYVDSTTGNLRFATYVTPVPDANCGMIPSNQLAWRCDTIEQIVPTGYHPPRVSVSLSMDGAGYPSIAYQSIPSMGPATLKIARPLAAYNYDVGNCGPVPDGGFMGTWLCGTVDGGGEWTDEAAFAAIGLRSNGLAIIAFTEDDNYHDTQCLKVAQQQIYSFIPVVRK